MSMAMAVLMGYGYCRVYHLCYHYAEGENSRGFELDWGRYVTTVSDLPKLRKPLKKHKQNKNIYI